MEDSRPRPVILESEKPKTVSGFVADWIPAESEYQRAVLSELCAIRQLLEKINQRQEDEAAPRIALMRKLLARREE